MHTHRNTTYRNTTHALLCVPRVYTGYILCSYSAYNHTAGVSVCISLGASTKMLSEALNRTSTIGHTNIAIALLAAGADVHYLDDYSIRYACEYGHYETVCALIDAGANVNLGDGLPLIYASSGGYYDIVSALLAAGAVIRPNAFQGAVIRGHTSIVSAFISAGHNIHYDNEMALLTTVSFEHTDIVATLLAAHANVNVAIEECTTPEWRETNGWWSSSVLLPHLRKLL